MNPSDLDSSVGERTLAERRRARLGAAFAAAKRDGLTLALHVRFATLAAIAVWILARQEIDAALLYRLAVVGVFAASGVAYVWLSARNGNRPWIAYAFVALDAVLLSVFLTVPNPFEAAVPWPMVLRGHGFVAYFVLLALVALSYSPALVLWFGTVSSLGWGCAIGLISLDARVKTVAGFAFAPLSAEQAMAASLDPWTIDLAAQSHDVLMLLIVSAMLAVVVRRSRNLVLRQAAAERERANLARYFSPTMIDELAEKDEPLAATRRQDLAVLFADIVGFTTIAAERPPEEVIALLRDFQGRMEGCAFAHRGTVDKYIGDAVMVTFGTPHPAPDDARRALECARAMLVAVAAWNEERRAAGEAPISIGIGAHFGPAVLGDIGSERRLEFAVVGDTVNVASRIEALTRTIDLDLLVSDALLARAQHAGADVGAFVDFGAQALRGREMPVRLWGYAPGRIRAAEAAQ